MPIVQSLSREDLHVLAFDGSELVSEVRCDGSPAGAVHPSSDVVTTPRNAPTNDVLYTHREVYHERGWRKWNGKVLCPRCVHDASAPSRARNPQPQLK